MCVVYVGCVGCDVFGDVIVVWFVCDGVDVVCICCVVCLIGIVFVVYCDDGLCSFVFMFFISVVVCVDVFDVDIVMFDGCCYFYVMGLLLMSELVIVVV